MTVKTHFEITRTPFKINTIVLSDAFLECRNFPYALTHQTQNYIGSHLHGTGGA